MFLSDNNRCRFACIIRSKFALISSKLVESVFFELKSARNYEYL